MRRLVLAGAGLLWIGAALAQDKPAPGEATPMAERQLVVRVIDKQTRKLAELTLAQNQPQRFGRLILVMRACEASAPTQPPESGGFLQIDEQRPGGQVKRVFSGWMFASTPALNAMEHPVYDAWVVQCKMSFPDTGPNTVVVRPPPPVPAEPAPDAATAPTTPAPPAPTVPAEPD